MFERGVSDHLLHTVFDGGSHGNTRFYDLWLVRPHIFNFVIFGLQLQDSEVRTKWPDHARIRIGIRIRIRDKDKDKNENKDKDTNEDKDKAKDEDENK